MPNDRQQDSGQKQSKIPPMSKERELVLRRFNELRAKEKAQEQQSENASAIGFDSPTNKMAKTELTPYHYERNRLAVEAMERMKKNPMSLEAFKEQVAMLERQRKNIAQPCEKH
jgi:hypothetical protein